MTGFGIFTSLARQGILAEAAMTSAGEELVRAETLSPYRLVVLGANEYVRDHPEVPALLVDYVEAGGTLLLPLGAPDRLEDPYARPQAAPALSKLAGCARLIGRDPANAISDVRSEHPAYDASATPAWELNTDEQPTLTRVEPVEGAEVLVRAGNAPLLYRHRLGTGTVYAFTWNLDVFVWRGAEVDYAGGNWDWLWRGLAAELGLRQDPDNEMTRTIEEMESERRQGSKAFISFSLTWCSSCPFGRLRAGPRGYRACPPRTAPRGAGSCPRCRHMGRFLRGREHGRVAAELLDGLALLQRGGRRCRRP